MFVEIDNTPRDYAWGSVNAIAELLGRPASGRPEAELWFGSHPMSPSKIVDPASVDGASNLAEFLATNPQLTGVHPAGDEVARLPFLLKILAAQTALSIQVHPSMEQARAGFERENAAGIAMDAPARNYRDASHKPELIFCVSPTFDALCGFRPIASSIASLREFIDEAALTGIPSHRLTQLISTLESSGHDVRAAVEFALAGDPNAVSELVAQLADIATGATPTSPIARDASTVRMLHEQYPGDPGLVVAFLMNRLTLVEGQALFVPHGVLHAYLHGLGIEIMAASDNVLRGGLTSKHVDVSELMSVGHFGPSEPTIVVPEAISTGVHRFAPGVSEFELLHVTVSEAKPLAGLDLYGPAIVLCTAGQATITGLHAAMEIRQGHAWFVTPDEQKLTLAGNAQLFVAKMGR